MDSLWFVLYIVLAAAAVLQAALLALQAWEHRRYGRSCIRALPTYRPTGRALVLAPCKGLDLDLEANLRALLTQDYHDYEVRFIVESKDDPAYPLIRHLMAEHPATPARVLVAGMADQSGQKVHNLRAATAAIPANIRYLAFLDSDARPRPEWLRMLVTRLCRPELGATTGYRWFLPQRPSLANHLLYSINCNLMALMAKHNHYLLWGGSWAIGTDTFRQIDLHRQWQGTLSDDLVASRLLHRAQRQTRFEPGCVTPTPIDHSLGSMFAFLRRQYLIGRYYTPGWWLFALAMSTLRNAAWLASLVALGESLGGIGPSPVVPLAFLAALYALGAYRGWTVQALAKTYFPDRYRSLRSARWFDILAGPVANLVHWVGLLTSAFGRHITWRGVRYRLLSGGRMAIEGYVPVASAGRIMIQEEQRSRRAA